MQSQGHSFNDQHSILLQFNKGLAIRSHIGAFPWRKGGRRANTRIPLRHTRAIGFEEFVRVGSRVPGAKMYQHQIAGSCVLIESALVTAPAFGGPLRFLPRDELGEDYEVP